MKRILFFCLALVASASCLMANSKGFSAQNTSMKVSEGNLKVSTSLNLDSLNLKTNQQLYIIPVIEGLDGASQVLPAVLVNGRNMHYLYQRGTVKKTLNYEVAQEVQRSNGKKQSVDYSATLPFRTWMLSSNSHLSFRTDTCGCGSLKGSGLYDAVPLNLNPVNQMKSAYITPAVTQLPVTVHEGRARVQFEVDRTELHNLPYVCRNGQRIDNRNQLQVIDDSVKYALSDPNVEIASINICGYASPESPYLHNEQLSTGRSKALAEYIAAKYNLPADRSTYNSVPENWKEFRDIVLKSNEITETQRHDLLALIDRPAYGPSDYDAKERELKTDKRFASLYRSLILPKWFPQLRATEFQISTRLKPMSDRQLAEVIKTSPEKMSLNQMMRVARLYPEGSQEFDNIIATALRYYPDDKEANLNGAIAALKHGDINLASSLVAKAGDSAEANNLRGIIATYNGEFVSAKKYFDAAKSLPEARHNASLINF